jgi:hypothetical protein
MEFKGEGHTAENAGVRAHCMECMEIVMQKQKALPTVGSPCTLSPDGGHVLTRLFSCLYGDAFFLTQLPTSWWLVQAEDATQSKKERLFHGSQTTRFHKQSIRVLHKYCVQVLATLRKYCP